MLIGVVICYCLVIISFLKASKVGLDQDKLSRMMTHGLCMYKYNLRCVSLYYYCEFLLIVVVVICIV